MENELKVVKKKNKSSESLSFSRLEKVKLTQAGVFTIIKSKKTPDLKQFNLPPVVIGTGLNSSFGVKKEGSKFLRIADDKQEIMLRERYLNKRYMNRNLKLKDLKVNKKYNSESFHCFEQATPTFNSSFFVNEPKNGNQGSSNGVIQSSCSKDYISFKEIKKRSALSSLKKIKVLNYRLPKGVFTVNTTHFS